MASRRPRTIALHVTYSDGTTDVLRLRTPKPITAITRTETVPFYLPNESTPRDETGMRQTEVFSISDATWQQRQTASLLSSGLSQEMRDLQTTSSSSTPSPSLHSRRKRSQEIDPPEPGDTICFVEGKPIFFVGERAPSPSNPELKVFLFRVDTTCYLTASQAVTLAETLLPDETKRGRIATYKRHKWAKKGDTLVFKSAEEFDAIARLRKIGAVLSRTCRIRLVPINSVKELCSEVGIGAGAINYDLLI